MSDIYIVGEKFSKKDYKNIPLEKGEYEDCEFIGCDFSDSDLSHIRFTECVFTSCNLSMTKMVNTSLQEVDFRECKMLGVQLDTCNGFLLEVSFDRCNMNMSSLYGMKLVKTRFDNCTLEEVNSIGADLSGAVFDNCDFTKAVFERTNLENADFTTSYNYIIDPEQNKIQGARFSLAGTPGLLTKYGILIK